MILHFKLLTPSITILTLIYFSEIKLTFEHSLFLVPVDSHQWDSSAVEAEAGLLACRNRRGRRLPTASVAPAPTVEESATRPVALHPKSSAPPL